MAENAELIDDSLDDTDAPAPVEISRSFLLGHMAPHTAKTTIDSVI
jgi:hypothetical protein